MWKLIYEILVNPLGLPIEPIWEYIILLVVGEIAHELAYWISPGGKVFGSLIYWISKLLVFVAVWIILYGIITAMQFVIAYWIWFVIAGAIILIVTIIFIVRSKKKMKQAELKKSK